MTESQIHAELEKPFDPSDEAEARALAAHNERARENGMPTVTRKRRNHWRLDASPERHVLDEETGEYVEFMPMNAGAKAAYERRTARDLYMQTGGKQSMRMSLNPAQDREALMEGSITDWNIERPEIDRSTGQEVWRPVPFNPANLREWLKVADPVELAELEDKIRKANPWLLNEQNLEDLYAARDEIEEQIKAKEDLEGESGA